MQLLNLRAESLTHPEKPPPEGRPRRSPMRRGGGRTSGFNRLVMLSLWLVLGAMTATAQGPSVPPLPRTMQIDGNTYVSLRHLARFYGFPRARPVGNQLLLEDAYIRIEFELNSRRIWVNGIAVWMHHPVTQHRRHWLVAEVDARTVLDPMLRPGPHVASLGYQRIVLDPGHGGSDPGGRGVQGSLEKELALDLSHRVADYLRMANNEVFLTRTDDQTLSLSNRMELARSWQADLFVSLHFNTAANPAARGSETFLLAAGGQPGTQSSTADSFPPATPANRFDGANQCLAYLVQQHLITHTQNQDRGVRRSRFFVLREATFPSILVEGGFLTNPEEEAKVLDHEYMERMAYGIAQGILAYQSLVLRAQLEH